MGDVWHEGPEAQCVLQLCKRLILADDGLVKLMDLASDIGRCWHTPSHAFNYNIYFLWIALLPTITLWWSVRGSLENVNYQK